jgi:hypothetical protein
LTDFSRSTRGERGTLLRSGAMVAVTGFFSLCFFLAVRILLYEVVDTIFLLYRRSREDILVKKQRYRRDVKERRRETVYERRQRK